MIEIQATRRRIRNEELRVVRVVSTFGHCQKAGGRKLEVGTVFVMERSQRRAVGRICIMRPALDHETTDDAIEVRTKAARAIEIAMSDQVFDVLGDIRNQIIE